MLRIVSAEFSLITAKEIITVGSNNYARTD